MENSKMVSVCLATYNGAEFITELLKSILNQLEENDEIILSDDNSSDHTLDCVRKIKDSRIHIYINKHKSGPVGNFENALIKAKGDYIFLADQDDVWLPGKIREVSNHLKVNDLVLSDCIVVNKSLEIIHPSFFTFRKSRPGFFYNLHRNSYVGCCMAFRREVLNIILPFPKNLHMHDWWIGLLVQLTGKVYFHQTPLILYIRHGNNASPTGENKSANSLQKQVLIRLILLKHLFFRVINQL